MKDYPSIPKALNEYIGRECTVFRKYDGTQIRIEYSKKKGWHKFATRGQLFDATDKNFGCCVEIFNRTLAGTLTKTLTDKYPKAIEAMAFCEFLGPHSFAGLHDPGILKVEHNDPKKLILFDINIHKKGILSPQEFREFTQYGPNINPAQNIGDLKLTEEFIKNVRESKYDPGWKDNYYTNEGVVCKGGSGHKIWMCKIKTWEYLKKIQKFFGTSWGQHWE